MRLLRKLIGLVLVGFVGYYAYSNFNVDDLFKYVPKEEVSSLIENVTSSESDLLCYTVDYVTDGDTFHITENGVDVLVRALGVDTPESVNPDETKNTPEGKIASEYTKNLISGKQVWLEFDKEQQDKYGRTLAYVWLDEAKTEMLQDRLLRDGMATCMPIKPNTKYQNRFAEIEEEAKKNNVGFWETEFWLD